MLLNHRKTTNVMLTNLTISDIKEHDETDAITTHVHETPVKTTE